MKLLMSTSELPGYSPIKVYLITSVLAVVSITAVNGNPALSDSCVTGLQTSCAQEVQELENQKGAVTCSYLSKVVSCVSCKLPNCTEVVTNLVQIHSEAPFNCQLNKDDIILLQKGEKYVELCLVWKPITTEKPGREPQVQDDQPDEINGVSQVSGMRLLYITVLSIITLLVTRQ